MKNNIKFSIVIALAPWREAEILESIKKLDYPASKFETIVIKGLNVPENRNKGVKKSKGEIIIFLDDDGVIEKDFLNKVESFINKYPQIDIFGGPQLTPKDDKFFARVNREIMAESLVCPGINNRYKKNSMNLNADSNFISGALFICKKLIFDKINFDPKQYPADEVTFIDKAKKLGYKIGYSPDIFIYHRGRKDLRGYLKQIYYFGNSRARKEGTGGIIKNPLFFIPALFDVYLLIVLLSWPINFNLMPKTIIFFPLLLYIILDLFSAIKIAITNKHLSSLTLTPFLIFLTHFFYGMGALSGIFNKKQKQGI